MCNASLDHITVPALHCNSFNIDISIKTRFVRFGRFENKSLHYINSYAVQGQINFDLLSDVQPHTCANSLNRKAALLLPSVEDDKAMRDLFITQNPHHPHGIFQVDI